MSSCWDTRADRETHRHIRYGEGGKVKNLDATWGWEPASRPIKFQAFSHETRAFTVRPMLSRRRWLKISLIRQLPDSSLRYRRYINHLLTYLLTYYLLTYLVIENLTIKNQYYLCSVSNASALYVLVVQLWLIRYLISRLESNAHDGHEIAKTKLYPVSCSFHMDDR